MSAAAKHSSRSSEWHTPVEIIEVARGVLGEIDLDPASCPAANERVRARAIITGEFDGLGTTHNGCWWWWTPHAICGAPGSIFLNPPSPALPWWGKLMATREHGALGHAIFIAFNAELLQTSQGRGHPSLASFPICAPAKRIRYLRADGTPGPSPTHSSLIVYVPGTDDRRWAFCDAFSPMGAILLPGGTP